MKRLRLAVFNTQPPHLYFGGVERRVCETAKLLKDEVDMTVYCGTKSGFIKPVSLDGMRVVPCFSTDKAFPVDNWFFNRTISGAVDSIRAEIFEAHAVSGYGFLRTLRRRKARKPFIQTVHGVLADEFLKAVESGTLTIREKLANCFMRWLSQVEAEASRNADMVVTVSQYSRKRIVQLYGVNEPKIRVVPNGVDPEKFKPMGSDKVKIRYGLENKRIVLFVGRLIPRKGLKYLVEAAVKVTREKPDTTFLIVGNGPLRNELLLHLGRLNLLKNFRFLGDVEERELPSLYSNADIFALPSTQEGQGIALLEAQASGTPIVAFDIGGVKEAVANGRSGFLVEKGNSLMFAKAILDLLSSKSLSEQMGAFGREFILRKFTWNICAQKMLTVYREALSAR